MLPGGGEAFLLACGRSPVRRCGCSGPVRGGMVLTPPLSRLVPHLPGVAVSHSARSWGASGGSAVPCPANACFPCLSLRSEQGPEVFLHNPAVSRSWGCHSQGSAPSRLETKTCEGGAWQSGCASSLVTLGYCKIIQTYDFLKTWLLFKPYRTTCISCDTDPEESSIAPRSSSRCGSEDGHSSLPFPAVWRRLFFRRHVVWGSGGDPWAHSI